jgi:hypothetical protein
MAGLLGGGGNNNNGKNQPGKLQFFVPEAIPIDHLAPAYPVLREP